MELKLIFNVFKEITQVPTFVWFLIRPCIYFEGIVSVH